MHILLVSTEFPPGPGGIGTHAFHLTRGLSNRGWEVTVIARQDYVEENSRTSFNQQHRFEIISIPHIESTIVDAWSRFHLIRRTIRAKPVKLVLCSGSQSVWLCSCLRQTTVAIGHGTEFGETGWRGMLTRLSFNRVDLVISVSNYTANYMLKTGIKPRKVATIHNGADSFAFSVLPEGDVTTYRAKLGFSASHRLLLTVGNVTQRKGQEVVIRALPHMLNHLPSIHYLIAGLPTLQTNLIRLATELGVQEHVHFLGHIDPGELNHLYNACDLFVMTSRNTDKGDFEGYGIAVIEAALCGKTAVVSDNSGLQEAVVDGVTGKVVPQNNPEATAQAVLSILDNPQTHRDLAQNAFNHALAHATWDNRVDQYDVLLREMIAK